MEITKELKKVIEVSVEKAVEKTVEKILKAGEQINKNDEEKKDYFKMTESLLYSYPSLKQQIESIDDYISTVNKAKSKSIVFWSNNGGGTQYDDTEARIKSRLESFERTRQDVLWIENALNAVKDRKEYSVLEIRYFQKKDDGSTYTFQEIAEMLDIDEKTARRRRTRIINDLSLRLWGSDAVRA